MTKLINGFLNRLFPVQVDLEVEALIKKCDELDSRQTVKDIKEPVYSFVKYLEKYPNYFHLRETHCYGGDRRYELYDSYHKITHKGMGYVNPVWFIGKPNRQKLWVTSSSIIFSDDEIDYLYTKISAWLAKRREKVSVHKERNTKNKQQKMRDKLTLMYKIDK